MLTIHTDGSSRPQTTKAAGWAFAVNINDRIIVRYGHLPPPSTNNIGELMALLVPLRQLSKATIPSKLHFITDSQYVQKGITEYMKGWKFRGWKTASGAKVKNLELWKEIHLLWNPSYHTVEWVRGHSGDAGNELVDIWANAGSDDKHESIDTAGLIVRRSNG